jgi:uncharacterized membrane protein
VSPAHRPGVVLALIVVLSAGCALLAHYAIVEARSPTLGALLSLLPVVGVTLALARRARRLLLVLPAVALAGAALWLGWDVLERQFTNLFFIEHAGINLLLATVFGRTLVGNSEALCTRFARILHGTLEPDVERYTRRVTLAWTLFFALQCVLSCILYFGNYLVAWSFLANIANPVLVVLMFLVEYAVRLRALPDHRQVGILAGIRAFSRHVEPARVQAPR